VIAFRIFSNLSRERMIVIVNRSQRTGPSREVRSWNAIGRDVPASTTFV